MTNENDSTELEEHCGVFGEFIEETQSSHTFSEYVRTSYQWAKEQPTPKHGTPLFWFAWKIKSYSGVADLRPIEAFTRTNDVLRTWGECKGSDEPWKVLFPASPSEDEAHVDFQHSFKKSGRLPVHMQEALRLAYEQP